MYDSKCRQIYIIFITLFSCRARALTKRSKKMACVVPYRFFEQGRTMHLLTEWEGRTGKYLARGDAVRTERSEVRRNDREPNIFPYGPT